MNKHGEGSKKRVNKKKKFTKIGLRLDFYLRRKKKRKYKDSLRRGL